MFLEAHAGRNTIVAVPNLGSRARRPIVEQSTMTEPLHELGRFAEPSLHILVSLSDGPKHGYAIMADVEAISGSPIGPGTLYGALARIERRGLIEALEPEQRRRPYRLTALGVTALEGQLEQLSSFARTGLSRLRGRTT
jgi:DNA-binding PadR family transcriptional regulator